MPTLTETLGFVVLEAMSSGLPVVAANGGGIPDLVKSPETGLLVDPHDPDAFASAIEEILSSRPRRRATAARARAFAESCDWPSETASLVEQYRDTIRRCSARRVGRGAALTRREAAAGGR
jgi:sulfoquinovosyltransferase